MRNKRERGKLKNTGKREKYFLTRFGDILYSRTRYKDRQVLLWGLAVGAIIIPILFLLGYW